MCELIDVNAITDERRLQICFNSCSRSSAQSFHSHSHSSTFTAIAIRDVPCLFCFDSFLWRALISQYKNAFCYLCTREWATSRLTELFDWNRHLNRPFVVFSFLCMRILCFTVEKFRRKETPCVFRRGNNMSHVTMLTRVFHSTKERSDLTPVKESSVEPKHGRPSTQPSIHRLLFVRSTASDFIFHISFA